MLSRFCQSSLRFVRLAQIINHSHHHSMPALAYFQQKSNYATESTAPEILKTKSLKLILKELKDRVENKRPSSRELQVLLAKLRTQQVDPTEALDILQCCTFARSDQNQRQIVHQIWKELKKQNNKYQIQHYNCMLQFARDKQDAKYVQTIFDEMISDGIKPDAISFQCLLSAYCKSGNIEKAVDILNMMDKSNLYINKTSFNDLVQCHIICGNIEAAKETMSSLKENGFKVNYYTLGALLSHYAKVGDLENIEKTFDLFKEEGIELLNRDIFKTICELAVNGHADKIDALLPHLQPNIELKRSLQNAVTLFVESKQSALVPKIVQLSAGDAKSIYRHLLREMLRLSSPESELKETIDRIEATGFTIEENFDIFRPALECSSEEIIRKLLAHMKDKSIEVSESTFEKLFRLSAEKGIKEVLDVVNLMCAEFKIQPRISFIRDVILPGLKVKENPALAFAKLQTTSIQLRKVTLAIINGLLNEGDIKTAYDFACSNQCFYGVELVERPLSRAYATTGDVSNFVSFVRLIYKSFDKINFYYNDKKLTNEEIQSKQKAFVGRILFEAIKHRQSETNSHTNLLNAFAEEGLTISAEDAEKILKHLKIDSDTQIGRVLQKLSTEQLELKPIKEQTNLKQMKILNQLSSADVQNILEVKLAQGHNAAATEKLLFLAYIREGNISEIESLIASNKFSISNSDYALLIELYTRTGNLENALNMLKRVCANNSSFKLDRIKVAKLVTLMVERDRSFDEIETLLMAHRQGKAEFRIFIFEHLLDKLAANAQSKMVDQLFDALVKHNYIEPTVESTGPMITSRLKSGAYAEAVDKFEQIAETYKLVPMSMVLFIHLIRSNEIDLLQRAFDIYEKVRGENSALRQLAFAFVECGQERQAKAIFENERLKNISKNIESECRKYVEHGKIESAKTLLKATKGIFCDRHVIYRTILDIYHKENKAQEALDLWVEYTTDGILPNQAFKTKLAVLLKANNMEIPFDLESKTTHKPNVDKEVVTN